MTPVLRVWTEKQFAQTVINMARAYHWIVGYTHDSRKSEPGEPDLRMVHPERHRVIFAELKTEKGRLSKGHYNQRQTRWLPGQDDWLKALRACPGIETFLWRPSDLDQIEAILRD
jgi:hypothetical protein